MAEGVKGKRNCPKTNAMKKGIDSARGFHLTNNCFVNPASILQINLPLSFVAEIKLLKIIAT